jgi:hypothetical protein
VRIRVKELLLKLGKHSKFELKEIIFTKIQINSTATTSTVVTAGGNYTVGSKESDYLYDSVRFQDYFYINSDGQLRTEKTTSVVTAGGN